MYEDEAGVELDDPISLRILSAESTNPDNSIVWVLQV